MSLSTSESPKTIPTNPLLISKEWGQVKVGVPNYNDLRFEIKD